MSIIFGNGGHINIINNKQRKLRNINLGFCKKVQFENNLIKFCKQIKEILKEFGIGSHISIDRSKNIFKFSQVRLTIWDVLSILKFCIKIGFLYSHDKKLKLIELVRNAKEMLERYSYYIQKYDEVMMTKKWDKQISWSAFYNWTRNITKPDFYDKKEEIVNLLSSLKDFETA